MAGRRQSFDFLGGGGGLHQSPEREQNQNPTPVACRLCGEVFMDNWVLIDHVGVHMGLDEASSRMRSERNRLSYPRDVTLLNPNPPCYYLVSSRPGLQAQQGGHLVPTAEQEMNHSVGGINPIGALPAASAPRGVLPVDSGNSHQFSLMLAPSPPPQAQQLAPKDLPGDRTRPFLDQLERRLTLEMKCRNDQKNVIKAEPGSAALDLTLKL
ncbi:hypothetical protein ACJRO7_029799 [Eucalyptus globulus]|uniref:C2H2-type domain-containing protein n=1 Tax=Eucalyptus globulus TaxID=34317 RepID=A0ABD3JKD5_EUCGL